MYRVSWSEEEEGGAVAGTQMAQYLADVAEVVGFAFGTMGAKFVVIAKQED